MHAPPPVRVVCSGGGLWQALLTGLPALAAAVFAAWLCGHAGLDAPATALLALGSAALAAALAWRGAQPGPAQLGWDGQAWWLDEQPLASLTPMLDLDRWVLLRAQAAGGGSARWLPAAARQAGAGWHGLRVAVRAARPTDAAGAPAAWFAAAAGTAAPGR